MVHNAGSVLVVLIAALLYATRFVDDEPVIKVHRFRFNSRNSIIVPVPDIKSHKTGSLGQAGKGAHGMNRLQGKTAIITGGAGGIGKGIAKAFVAEGAKVAIVDLNADAGSETLKELQKIQPDCLFIQANLMAHDKIPDVVKQVTGTLGKLDVLVNNAHASKMVPIEKMGKAELDLSFNTGFYATLVFMQASLPYLKESKGKIINFASGAGINGDVNQGSYAAAKEAIRGISRVAANEFGPFGINVNIISPIAKSEGMVEWAKANPEPYEAMIAKIPLRRLGEIEDIARVAVFLASSDADYITGQTIMVDGGSIKLR